MQLKNKIGLIGVIPSIAFGVEGFFVAMNAGPRFIADTSFPVALLAKYISSQFTSPPSLIRAGSERLALTFDLYQIGTALIVALFAYSFWLSTDLERTRSEQRNNALLAFQLMLSLAGQLDLSYFIALEIAILLPLRLALKWLVAIVVGCMLVRLAYLGILGAPYYSNAVTVLGRIAIVAIMQAIAFGVGALVATERRSRIALAAAHAKLQATQQLLADMTRSSERLRMTRDLHDAIGHHLTALNLHLNLAAHQQTTPNESIAIARTLAQGLMAEVRTVVSAHRKNQCIDLRQALQTLCAGIPTPTIVLEFDTAIVIDSPTIAHAVFHSIQEALTNAVRHARASRVEIAVRISGADLVATITDDGIGKSNLAHGNGLRGIQERVAALGGTLVESTPPQDGFCLQITLPLEVPA